MRAVAPARDFGVNKVHGTHKKIRESETIPHKAKPQLKLLEVTNPAGAADLGQEEIVELVEYEREMRSVWDGPRSSYD